MPAIVQASTREGIGQWADRGLVRALGFSLAFLGDVAVLLISLRNARFFSFLKVEGRFEPRKLLMAGA